MHLVLMMGVLLHVMFKMRKDVREFFHFVADKVYKDCGLEGSGVNSMCTTKFYCSVRTATLIPVTSMHIKHYLYSYARTLILFLFVI